MMNVDSVGQEQIWYAIKYSAFYGNARGDFIRLDLTSGSTSFGLFADLATSSIHAAEGIHHLFEVKWLGRFLSTDLLDAHCQSDNHANEPYNPVLLEIAFIVTPYLSYDQWSGITGSQGR
jgi:hypothetical protein